MRSEDERYERALRRAQELKGFYIHLGVFLIVNTMLFTINMLTNSDSLWFYWPLLGWGIGVAVHGFALTVEGRYLDERWEQRKARELMRRDETDGRAA